MWYIKRGQVSEAKGKKQKQKKKEAKRPQEKNIKVSEKKTKRHSSLQRSSYMSRLLWKPSEEFVKSTNMYKFMEYANKRFGMNLSDYKGLYKWSVESIPDFWGSLWDFLEIKASRGYDSPVRDLSVFPGTEWFPGAMLNYAENVLKFHDSDRTAIIFRGEDKERRELSFKEVYSEVTKLAASFRKAGIRKGDAIAAYMPNLPETIIAMLAAAAIGAVWCSCATDIGSSAAIDRLGQVSPKLIVTADGYFYKGKEFNVLENAEKIANGIPSAEKVVIVHYAGDREKTFRNAVRWEDFIEKEEQEDFKFEQLPAMHPLVVMFSSGTTGKPKCMVQSAGGLLINQLKELALQADMKPDDRLLYISTCSWMMWNWMLAGLGTGSSLVLYDGNPSWPDTAAIWNVLAEEKVTVFGLSASYVHSLISQGFKHNVDLSHLREISQTGSALSLAGFDYIYDSIKSDLHFNSISGGTDINGCFASGNPISPVYAGELQGAGLGMKINSYDDDGRPVRDVQGELVCEAPAPSMPIYFWNDPTGEKYKNAYFLKYPGIWHHGDYVMFHSDTGGISFYGRSDSVLKPSGVRIGTAEIYNQVEKLEGIEDSLAIGQTINGDQRIVLFVKMKEGAVLDDDLKKLIKKTLRVNASPRHVPAVIMEMPEVPVTLNMKKVESAVTNILNGRKVTNRDALANPSSLDYFEKILPELQK